MLLKLTGAVEEGALRGRCSAINLPLGGDTQVWRPLPLALYPPAPRVRRRSVARLSEHTGGLGAPQAVGLEAPPRVVSRAGGGGGDRCSVNEHGRRQSASEQLAESQAAKGGATDARKVRAKRSMTTRHGARVATFRVLVEHSSTQANSSTQVPKYTTQVYSE